MDMPFLMAVSATQGNASKLAREVMMGDESALTPLQDAIMEEFNVDELIVEQNYYIETVTHYYVGKLVKATFSVLVLEQVCKVYDTGVFSKFMSGELPQECEPIPNGILTRIPVASITLVIDWPNKLLRNRITGGSHVA